MCGRSRDQVIMNIQAVGLGLACFDGRYWSAEMSSVRDTDDAEIVKRSDGA